MFSEDFEAWVEGNAAGVECRGLRWVITGWLDEPEMSRDSDEVQFSGPAEGDPGIWLSVRHTFDRTWQVRVSASCEDWADWPGARIDLSHTGSVDVDAIQSEQPDSGRSGSEWEGAAERRTDPAEPPGAPVWSWHLGAEGWLMVADHYHQPVLFGSLRRGMATDTDEGLVIPPARLEPGVTRVTAWAVQELAGVAQARSMLPSWLPVQTGVWSAREITLDAPDHGLSPAPGSDIVIAERDGLTMLSSEEPFGCVHDVLLHSARGTITLPLAFGKNLEDLIPDWAHHLVERHRHAEELPAEEAVILSLGASFGIADSAELLERLPIRTTGGAGMPLVVDACARELTRTGDPAWAGRMANAIEYLPAVPGAVSAMVRAVVSVFSMDGEPRPYLDHLQGLAQQALDAPCHTAADMIVALEAAAVGGTTTEEMVERVVGLLGWGMPLSPVLPVDPRTAVQAIAAITLVEEGLVTDWQTSPAEIGNQAIRWILAQHLSGLESPMELAAWLTLPVTDQ
ncbi:hypothetical protein [Enemella sp. A6]|uniref:hypothetical protein n=1 Tax=Enemella sp. A6 TaxID=3440152 RepID=UPI003EB711F3